jgi:hypothetical protein
MYSLTSKGGVTTGRLTMLHNSNGLKAKNLNSGRKEANTHQKGGTDHAF